MNPAPVIWASPIHALEAARSPPPARLGVGPRPPIQKVCQNNPKRQSLSAFSKRNGCENLQGKMYKCQSNIFTRISCHSKLLMSFTTETRRNSHLICWEMFCLLLYSKPHEKHRCYSISNLLAHHISFGWWLGAVHEKAKSNQNQTRDQLVEEHSYTKKIETRCKKWKEWLIKKQRKKSLKLTALTRPTQHVPQNADPILILWNWKKLFAVSARASERLQPLQLQLPGHGLKT